MERFILERPYEVAIDEFFLVRDRDKFNKLLFDWNKAYNATQCYMTEDMYNDKQIGEQYLKRLTEEANCATKLSEYLYNKLAEISKVRDKLTNAPQFISEKEYCQKMIDYCTDMLNYYKENNWKSKIFAKQYCYLSNEQIDEQVKYYSKLLEEYSNRLQELGENE